MDRENYCARSLRRRAFEIVLMAVAMFLSPLVCWVGVFCYTGCRVLICKWKEPRRTTFLFTFFHVFFYSLFTVEFYELAKILPSPDSMVFFQKENRICVLSDET